MSENTSSKTALRLIVSCATLIGLWVAAAFVSALHQVNWQVSELARQYMIAVGMIQPFHTLVDFYSHIKGVEYLICVAFFVALPVYFKYINKEKRKLPIAK